MTLRAIPTLQWFERGEVRRGVVCAYGCDPTGEPIYQLEDDFNGDTVYIRGKLTTLVSVAVENDGRQTPWQFY